MLILKLRKGKLEYILYDTMGKEQLEWVLHLFKIDLILISGV